MGRAQLIRTTVALPVNKLPFTPRAQKIFKDFFESLNQN